MNSKYLHVNDKKEIGRSNSQSSPIWLGCGPIGRAEFGIGIRFKITFKNLASMLSDNIALRHLAGSLDTLSRPSLQRIPLTSPALTLARFLEVMGRELGRDASHLHQDSWMQVNINIKGRGMTLEDIRNFGAGLLAQAKLVENKWVSEAWDLLLGKLPKFLQQR